jgi:type I restriction enzyme M protein
VKYWQALRDLHVTGMRLMDIIGTKETNDYNVFRDEVAATLKAQKIKLSATEKNAILNAVSWYDEDAEKVVDKKLKLTGDKLDALLHRLGCTEVQLADFGYYRKSDGSYLTYESNSDLRDAESVPLKDSVHDYFLAEVQPHGKREAETVQAL